MSAEMAKRLRIATVGQEKTRNHAENLFLTLSGNGNDIKFVQYFNGLLKINLERENQSQQRAADDDDAFQPDFRYLARNNIWRIQE